jgi:ArsR family transcriptional regulator
MVETKVKVLRSVSHPVRLLIVELLAEEDRTAHDFVLYFGSDFATVHKHLNILMQARIIASRKENKKVVYSLEMKCISNVLKCIEGLILDKKLDI